jgi:hypothetical protein
MPPIVGNDKVYVNLLLLSQRHSLLAMQGAFGGCNMRLSPTVQFAVWQPHEKSKTTTRQDGTTPG